MDQNREPYIAQAGTHDVDQGEAHVAVEHQDRDNQRPGPRSFEQRKIMPALLQPTLQTSEQTTGSNAVGDHRKHLHVAVSSPVQENRRAAAGQRAQRYRASRNPNSSPYG